MKTGLPNDPTQLQVMLQVARSVSSQGPDATVEQLRANTTQALDLLDLDPAQARGALVQLQAWEAQPAAQAQRFLGELSVKTGLTKTNLSEAAVLSNLGALSPQLSQAKRGLPADVKLPPAELSSLWDGQHARLAADFPKIVMDGATSGAVNLQDLIPDDLPFTVTPDLIQRIEAGVDPRTHLHPGGIVGSEIVAQLADIKPGDKVLDLCSGEGGVARYFAEAHGADVTTYEVSDAATAVAQRKAQQSGYADRLDIRGQSISKIDAAPGSVNAVTGTDADGIHYVEDRQVVFERAFDALADGGAFVFKAYVPGERPEGIDEAKWQDIKQGFDASMGWGGEDKSQDVRPTGINAENYVEQLVQAGFKREDIEIFDLNKLYTSWQTEVGNNQKARGHDDAWAKDWMDLSQQSGRMGFVIRAKKQSPAD